MRPYVNPWPFWPLWGAEFPYISRSNGQLTHELGVRTRGSHIDVFIQSWIRGGFLAFEETPTKP